MALDWRPVLGPVDSHGARAGFGIVYASIVMKMVASKSLVLDAVETNENGIYTEIDLIEQDRRVLLQLGVVGSKIRSLKTVVVHLVYCLITPIFSI